MFDLKRAALYAARFGISRAELEEALRTEELAAETLPGGGWVIGPADPEAWITGRSS